MSSMQYVLANLSLALEAIQARDQSAVRVRSGGGGQGRKGAALRAVSGDPGRVPCARMQQQFLSRHELMYPRRWMKKLAATLRHLIYSLGMLGSSSAHQTG